MQYLLMICGVESDLEAPSERADEDLDEAIEVASKHPGAKFGTIEVRPLWED